MDDAIGALFGALFFWLSPGLLLALLVAAALAGGGYWAGYRGAMHNAHAHGLAAYDPETGRLVWAKGGN
ncbi:hypothetical protein [Poseidonocella sp. HB161398]|uniref:hypothetical protein n=1 Tax=Poseidonocella sp. HB161398 TaxID=2320855 RepID=UPI00110808B7|nr:hypothetical protein [Poseidonocella sp. HB161398]